MFCNSSCYVRSSVVRAEARQLSCCGGGGRARPARGPPPQACRQAGQGVGGAQIAPCRRCCFFLRHSRRCCAGTPLSTFVAHWQAKKGEDPAVVLLMLLLLLCCCCFHFRHYYIIRFINQTISNFVCMLYHFNFSCSLRSWKIWSRILWWPSLTLLSGTLSSGL